MKGVGERIKDLRREKNITQSGFCAIIGISVPTLSKIEAGVLTPNLEKLEAIAGAFSITVGDLLKEGEIKAKDNSAKNGKTMVNHATTGHFGYIDGYGMFSNGDACAFMVVPLFNKVFQVKISDLTVII
jgi:transcriptional regulator with XRE-family HTH domain